MILLAVVIVLGWWIGAGIGILWMLLKLLGWVISQLILAIPVKNKESRPAVITQKVRTPESEGFIL